MDLILERRRVVISDENLGPIVSIVSILLLISVILTVLARISFRYFLRRRLTLEDGIVFVAAILSIGELVTVLGSDDNGLGSPIQRLSAEQLDRFQQYTYAAGVLYVLNLGLTKISVLLLIHEITPRKGQKVAIRSVLGFTALWTISSVLALFFQCHTPQTWRFIDNQCIDRTGFWVFYTVVHILTEFMLILLPTWVMWKVRLLRSKKLLVLFPFSLRILAIIPAIAQLIYLVPAHSSDNPTFDLWPSVLCSQITQTLAIITACFLQLKPFFTSLNSGLLRHNGSSRRFRDGSRDASGYLSLSHKSAEVRSRSPRIIPDLLALPSDSREGLSVGARSSRVHFEDDMVESADGDCDIPASKPSEAARVIHQTTSIANEYSNKDSSELHNPGAEGGKWQDRQNQYQVC